MTLKVTGIEKSLATCFSVQSERTSIDKFSRFLFMFLQHMSTKCFSIMDENATILAFLFLQG